MLNLNSPSRSSCFDAVGLAVSWELWDVGSIPVPEEWVKDLMLMQLRCRSHMQLRSDSWPGNSVCYGASKKKRKKNSLNIWKRQVTRSKLVWILAFLFFSTHPLFSTSLKCTNLYEGGKDEMCSWVINISWKVSSLITNNWCIFY